MASVSVTQTAAPVLHVFVLCVCVRCNAVCVMNAGAVQEGQTGESVVCGSHTGSEDRGCQRFLGRRFVWIR